MSQKVGAVRGISEITSVVAEGEEEPVQSVARRTVLHEGQELCFQTVSSQLRTHMCAKVQAAY